MCLFVLVHTVTQVVAASLCSATNTHEQPAESLVISTEVCETAALPAPVFLLFLSFVLPSARLNTTTRCDTITECKELDCGCLCCTTEQIAPEAESLRLFLSG